MPRIHISGFLSAATLFALSISTHAEQKILFIGNSFTYGEGGTTSVPEIFDRLAIAGGHEDPTTEMRAVGGQSFEFHENDATSQAAIASRQWDYVILQNYSTQPTHIGSVEDHMTYGTLLYDRVIANHSATQVILYETWARSAKHSLITGSSTASTFATTSEMQSELRTNYQALALALTTDHPENAPVLISPVGDAWENAGGLLAESDTDFADLHGSDEYHGNDNGYFLSAAVFYATIYGESPEGLHTEEAISSLGLNLTEDPAFLERMAWQTVTGTVELSFVSQPTSQTVSENQSVTFNALIRGSEPESIQWFKNDKAIDGANELSYTIQAADSDLNGAVFKVEITNAVSTLTSDPVVLTVTSDEVPPTPLEASLTDSTTIQLGFSEALASEQAAIAANYTVAYHGEVVKVISATLSSDGKSVTLVLESSVEDGFVVGVNPVVTDIAGNAFSAGSLFITHAQSASGSSWYCDFGATVTSSTTDPDRTWNNVTSAVAATDSGVLGPLLDEAGNAGNLQLEMIRRFNDANPNGTLTATDFPTTASQDSFYGNTEFFNERANIFPAFKITGLDPAMTYSLTFYASRTDVSDNRETLYTVTGASVNSTSLNPSNNINTVAVLTDLTPTAEGVLTIEVSPGSSNNNAYHFTYLGALIISASSTEEPQLYKPVVVQGNIVVDWSGTGVLESNVDLGEDWTEISPSPQPPYTELITEPSRFFRLSFTKP
ncbi:hypothetical protein JIN85_00985 [Luteolibacter pohnpeiensis]|uniref:Immunoglobulin I-set domain-containing protein n=1 Tax=Luteolibacter pohnpeiensis TaxID=454153 RepID=A0A934S571_9BACT|nr:DUF4886 domain-containing protein [Luteolibacter pohnpeiensis]MBK1880966.1 hypothetical protein [Luteolibacter pohnpeiensis]